MNRLFAYSACTALSFFMLTPVQAQDLMPPYVMEQLGLEEAWSRPVQVPAGSQSIADQQLFVHEENPREYVEIVRVTGEEAEAGDEKAEVASDQVIARIPTDRVGPDGTPIGRKEAERLANNQIRRLKRRGIEAKTNVRTVPRVHLYTVASNGMMECRDAETGEPIWTVVLGDRRLPFNDIGTEEHYLTVINGSNLLQLDAATGIVQEEVRMTGAPRFGAINSGDFAMVPLIGGGVGGYPLDDPTRDPFHEIVAGSALTLPTKAPASTRIAWGTDRGFVYVMDMEGTNPQVLFRLNTDGIVSGRVAAATGERFFFGSDAGQVYGLRATRSGTVLWTTPVGEPFYNEPMVAGGQVVICSTYGNLYSLNTADGKMTWEQPVANISELIASFDGRLFVTTLSGALAVIDLESGQLTSSHYDVRPDRLLVNKLTNRLYLVSNAGDVQCLKPTGADLPTFSVQPDVKTTEAVADAKPQKDTTPFAPGGGDPFGAGGADPFGGGGADPFGGGGADPFGGGGGADPFGGGGDADPFGGGGGGDPFGGGGDAPMDDPFGGANPF